MKKLFTLFTAAVFSAGMSIAFAANAAEAPEPYDPLYYFKADEATGVEILKYGTVYVDKTKASADGAVIACSVYIKDDQKLAGNVIAKWQCDNKSLVLKDLATPNEKYGKTPFSYFNDSPDEVLLKEYSDMNMHSVAYSTFSSDPMALTGETTDAYPFACFNAALDKDAKGGSYDINIISKGDYISSVTPRYEDKTIFNTVDMADKSENLRINVSDRKLGDINNDGFVDAVDSAMILKEYASMSGVEAKSTLDGDQAAAADVNGNRIIDAVDASAVLGFYAYVSSGNSDKTLNSFIKGE